MASHPPSRATEVGRSSPESQEALRRFTWEIRSINVCLEDFRQFRASALGITGPQLMILMALMDLDGNKGGPVNRIAKLMNVDPSFVTTQSKLLEKKGFLHRKPCDRMLGLYISRCRAKPIRVLRTSQHNRKKSISLFLVISVGRN